MLIADNLRITSAAISRAVEKMDPDPIRELTRRCVAAGAEAVDINSGPLNREPERKMTFLVETVREVTNLPLLIDTANPEAMEAGLAADRKTTIINAFSLEPKKLEYILPLAVKYNCSIIGYLLYPNGHVPPDASERLVLATELFNAAEAAGIDRDKLIIDPIIVPVIWNNGNFQAMEVLSVIRELPELLGFPAKTIAALSNLTSGEGPSEKKRRIEKAYLPMLLAAGLDMLLLDFLREDVIETARTCRAIIKDTVFCWECV